MIKIYTDGATEGYNGKLGTVKFCGIGFVIPSEDFEYSNRIPAISNNEAEFWALITAMKYAILNNYKEVEFLLDSQIVVNRANGARPKKAKHQNERMDALQNRVLEFAKSFTKIKFTWIRREQNWRADIASKKSLASRS
jgi:ribonuclease HI